MTISLTSPPGTGTGTPAPADSALTQVSCGQPVAVRRRREAAFTLPGAIALLIVGAVGLVLLGWLVWHVVNWLEEHFPQPAQIVTPTNIAQVVTTLPLSDVPWALAVTGVTNQPSTALGTPCWIISRSMDLSNWVDVLAVATQDARPLAESLCLDEAANWPTNHAFYRWTRAPNAEWELVDSPLGPRLQRVTAPVTE